VVIFGVHANPRYPDVDEVPDTVLINPLLTPLGEELEEGWEGCLSVPGLRGVVPRWTRIRYTGFDPQGNPIENAEQTLVGLRTARPDTAAAVSEAICHAPVSKTVVDWMAEMFVETSPRADATLADLAHNVDLRDKLPQIQAPALVFGGRHDVFVPYAIAETAVEMLPNARFVSCEESGHGVPIEEPDLYLRELRAFLGELG
jgi:pimeloyl-ACP methyl ester carboxylesterase